MGVSLRERMVVFLDDLRRFNEDTLLENYTDSSFMSETYFTLGEIDMLKNRTVEKKMLRQRLDDLFEKRMEEDGMICSCLLYTSPSPRDGLLSRMPSSA